MTHHAAGQAIVETAIAFPILMGILFAIVGAGLYLVADIAQQGRTQTLADWAASNTTGDVMEYAVTLTNCPCTVETTDDGTTVATITCPSIAHALVPVLPAEIVTSATSYRRTDP